MLAAFLDMSYSGGVAIGAVVVAAGVLPLIISFGQKHERGTATRGTDMVRTAPLNGAALDPEAGQRRP